MLPVQPLIEFVGILAWPLVVVIVLVVFRTALRDLLSRDDVSVSGPAGITISARRAAGALVHAEVERSGPVDHEAEADASDQAREVTAYVQRLRRSPRALWVDDRPSNNRHERWALENMGITVDLSTSTDAARAKLRSGGYCVVISDMARPEDPRAGYLLLDWMREEARDTTPFVVYSSSDAPEHYDEAIAHGALGSTARPAELVDMVLRALREVPPPARRWRLRSSR
jgi:CheY-like chemotaxis protein